MDTSLVLSFKCGVMFEKLFSRPDADDENMVAGVRSNQHVAKAKQQQKSINNNYFTDTEHKFRIERHLH